MEVSSSGRAQNSGKTKYQLLLTAGLERELEKALELSPGKIAAEIEKFGFSCQRCGKCCRREYGDNRVTVIPAEIEKIQAYMGLSKLEVAGPLLPEVFFPAGGEEKNGFAESEGNFELLEDEIDSEGRVHAFGWMLRRKRDGDCIFLEKGTSTCRAYPVRPMLCETYPFYLEELKLYTCECEGLGYPISPEESLKLAKALLFRYVSELEDMLAMYEKFENFEKGGKRLALARKQAEKGPYACVIHDSSGAVEIRE